MWETERCPRWKNRSWKTWKSLSGGGFPPIPLGVLTPTLMQRDHKWRHHLSQPPRVSKHGATTCIRCSCPTHNLPACKPCVPVLATLTTLYFVAIALSGGCHYDFTPLHSTEERWAWIAATGHHAAASQSLRRAPIAFHGNLRGS